MRQRQAERDRRQQELNTLAKVNIAEGEKKSAILHSEGHLIATKNQAEAEFSLEQRRADAKRYTIEQETVALTNQINEIADQLDGNNELALKFLLSRRRFDELQSIANGPNNSVYFLNNNVEGYDSMKIFADILKRE